MLEEILADSSAMEREVIEDVISSVDSVEELKSRLDEILEHGCISGTVGSMIYYSDTVAFFERHKEEINNRLAELIENTGLNLCELFKNFDNCDPLCLDTYNQNLFAWYGYEDVCANLRDMIEEMC